MRGESVFYLFVVGAKYLKNSCGKGKFVSDYAYKPLSLLRLTALVFSLQLPATLFYHRFLPPFPSAFLPLAKCAYGQKSPNPLRPRSSPRSSNFLKTGYEFFGIADSPYSTQNYVTLYLNPKHLLKRYIPLQYFPNPLQAGYEFCVPSRTPLTLRKKLK